MRTVVILILLIQAICAISVADNLAQKISLSSDSSYLAPNQKSTISLFYESDNGLPATGIGIRVYFDSSEIQLNSLSNVLPNSNIGIQTLKDTENYDGNTNTDKYIVGAWANVNGGWPNVPLQPVKLFDLQVLTSHSFEGTQMNAVVTSSDVNFKGVGSSLSILGSDR